MTSPLAPFAAAPECGEDHAGDVLPTAPGRLLPIFPRAATGKGSSTALTRRGWSLLMRSPSASLSAPVIRYALQTCCCCSQRSSSELCIAKKPFKKHTSLLVVFSLVLNDKYFIKCLPSSLCFSVLSSSVCAVI